MKYTKSAFLDTFDFIKTIIYIIDLIVQISYIGYLSYRIIDRVGFVVTNVILLVISASYLLYHLLTTKEFYTVEEVESKKTAKIIVKIAKRIVNLVIIGLSIYQIAISKNVNNMTLFTTMMLILGFIISIFGDIIVKIINDKAMLIFSAIKYDLNQFREEHFIVTGAINALTKRINLDIKEIPLEVDNQIVTKIKNANHRQELKARRKRVFAKTKNN